MLSSLGIDFVLALAYAGVVQGMGAIPQLHTRELIALMYSRGNEDSLLM